MFWWIYNVVFAVGFALMAPYYLWRMWRRGGYAKSFSQRFGIYPDVTRARLKARRRLWVHAVSVGEVYVALRFMELYREEHPDIAFALTTNTSTGHGVAEARLHDDDVLLYFPVDLPCFVNRVLDAIDPLALVLTECELWPNLVRVADRRGIPLVLLNGRVSDGSYRGYRFLKRLFGMLLDRFDLLLMQGQRDADRIVELGAPVRMTHTLGTAKYDVATRDSSRIALIRNLLDTAGIPEGVPLLVGGSTWPGEERALLEIYQALAPAVAGLKLVLVPRHFERAAEVEQDLRALGVNYVKRSELQPGAPCEHPADVVLLDSTGELVGLYAHASLIFVGKSLFDRGGQNIIEPALFGKPVLFGPHMENFPVVVNDFLSADAAIQVADQADLQSQLLTLFEQPARAQTIGERAEAVVLSKRGCLARSVALIEAVRLYDNGSKK
ncbi:MAG: 3-deoxy-D-manno-octulosonic acid transferase [Lentisphaerae bacterium]|nr:3-deoxy-D-manno-octulosonic acid transferase [Lentisphaerota bacterium]